MNALIKLTFSIAAIAITAGAPSALGSTLTAIPIPSWLPGTTANEGRAISPDGKFVVGVSGTSSQGGFLYDVANNLVIQPTNSSGDVPSTATGVAYRTDPISSQEQLIIDGLAAGIQANWMTPDGGVTWGAARRDASFTPATSGGYNTLGAAVGSDLFYQVIRDSTSKQLYTNQGSNTWDSVTSPSFRQDALTFSIDNGGMNGVSAAGRAAGQKKINASGPRLNFVIEYPPDAATAFLFNGLAGTTEGEAFSVSADGNTVFGRSPTNAGDANLYGYKVINPGPSQVISALPEFNDTGGSTSRCVPYGCTADGNIAVGMNFRGALDERAVFWDTSDSNPTNWTIVDLTDLANSEGILGSFTRLARGYSIGRNAAGNLVVTGFGFDASANRRAFVMVIGTAPVPQPSITQVTGVGTGGVTVNYTNTLAGTNYTLQYNTNLNTGNWYDVSTAPAAGGSTSQTDTNAIPGEPQRYYRVRTP